MDISWKQNNHYLKYKSCNSLEINKCQKMKYNWFQYQFTQLLKTTLKEKGILEIASLGQTRSKGKTIYSWWSELIYSCVVQDSFQSIYWDRKNDLTHFSMQIKKPLVEQNYNGSVDKFHFILAKQNFAGLVQATVVHELID